MLSTKVLCRDDYLSCIVPFLSVTESLHTVYNISMYHLFFLNGKNGRKLLTKCIVRELGPEYLHLLEIRLYNPPKLDHKCSFLDWYYTQSISKQIELLYTDWHFIVVQALRSKTMLNKIKCKKSVIFQQPRFEKGKYNISLLPVFENLNVLKHWLMQVS